MDLVELIVLKMWTIRDSRIEFKETLRVLCVFQGCALFRQRPTQPFAVTQPKPFSHDRDFVAADCGFAVLAAAAANLGGDQTLPRRQIEIETPSRPKRQGSSPSQMPPLIAITQSPKYQFSHIIICENWLYDPDTEFTIRRKSLSSSACFSIWRTLSAKFHQSSTGKYRW